MRWIGLLSLGVLALSAGVMGEAYAGGAGDAAFDHTAFDRLLAAHVDRRGWVDYAGFTRDAGRLDAYLAAVAAADFQALGRDEKLALLINTYNAATIRLIHDHGGAALDSILDIPEARRWDDARWPVAGGVFSLNQIEHELIRPNFQEPRIHFALVCAAVGCPPLRHEAYTGGRLERQLADQSAFVHTHDRWLRFDPATGRLELTRLYEWYAGDFKQAAGSVLSYVAGQAPPIQHAIDAGQTIRIGYLNYDWALNDVKNRP